MLFVVVDLLPVFAAAADDSGFIPSSELSSSVLSSLSGEVPLLIRLQKDKVMGERVSSSSAVWRYP